jgi:hypothetical protein
VRVVAIAAAIVCAATSARADDDFAGASVIFPRGGTLYRVDPKGKNETAVATLPAKTAVRTLRTDATGSILLANLGGTWAYLPLDGATQTFIDLPCTNGPAQLAEDGACVLCRGAKSSIIYNFKLKQEFPIDVPAPGTRLAGVGAARKLVWADATGIWSSPPGDPAKKTRLAAEAPLRYFSPSPDGARAVGVYADEVYDGVKKKKPGDVLMGFALDGDAARRKLVKTAVPIEWSHDARYVLVQDGTTACMVSTAGGEYKCWRGFVASSIASDGRWGLVLGSKVAPKVGDPDADVPITPPAGPLSLYRGKLEGLYTEAPVLIVKVVDGPAVWVPAKP